MKNRKVKITAENMHKYAAMLRFQIEGEIGHALPADAIRAEIKDGVPMIIVSTPDGKEQA